MRYDQQDLVRVARRENNTKRKYLVVNLFQGKHVPASPSRALGLFTCLADTIRHCYDGERLLIVGFAETATAIGAQVALSLGADYIHTTRERLPGVGYLFFSEEHSHAAGQTLVRDDIDRKIADIDRIIFVEDEVTTGNTILNMIRALEHRYEKHMSFSVASLLNGMKEEHLSHYLKREIALHYLIKTDHSAYEAVAEQFAGDGAYVGCAAEQAEALIVNATGKSDPRRLVGAKEYEKACQDLWRQVAAVVGEISGERILVVGTEECMYPALYVGIRLEQLGNDVWSHSTTRSPIVVSGEEGYPLHTRYELRSVYDSDRRTFLYEIDAYDRVFVVTDAPSAEGLGMHTLINALRHKNSNLTVVRWC